MSEPRGATSPAATELLLRVNGIQAAFGIEFGLDNPRANEGRAADPYRQANVSYSLVQRQNGQLVRHTLIGCGSPLAGDARLHSLLPRLTGACRPASIPPTSERRRPAIVTRKEAEMNRADDPLQTVL
jgi:hypothetical protein